MKKKIRIPETGVGGTEFEDGMKQKIHFPEAFHQTLFRGNLQNEERVNRTDLYGKRKRSDWLKKRRTLIG